MENEDFQNELKRNIQNLKNLRELLIMVDLIEKYQEWLKEN